MEQLPLVQCAPGARAPWHPGGMTAAGQTASSGGADAASDPRAATDPGATADPGKAAPAGWVRAETVERLQQAMGSLGTAAMASMEERLPWFRSMSAEHRSWIGLVAQAGIAAFVDWVKHPERGRAAVAGEGFGTAPRELARAASPQQAGGVVRGTLHVFEARVAELAGP